MHLRLEAAGASLDWGGGLLVLGLQREALRRRQEATVEVEGEHGAPCLLWGLGCVRVLDCMLDRGGLVGVVREVGHQTAITTKAREREEAGNERGPRLSCQTEGLTQMKQRMGKG